MIIVGIILLVVLIAVVWELIYFDTTAKQEVYILPNGFKGIVLVAYGQSDGLDDVKRDGKLIYKIPPNGVLKLKRKEATTITQTWYYFEDEQGKRTEFYYCYPPCEEMKSNPDKVFAYGASNGASLDGDYELRRTIFLVGTFHDKDSLNKADEKFNPIEVLRNSK